MLFPKTIRNKLLALWLLTILLVLGVAGVFFVPVLKNLYEGVAREEIINAFSNLRLILERQRIHLDKNLGYIASRSDVISSVSMIDGYEDPLNYDPIIFDVEKRKLVRMLANQIGGGILESARVYDSKGSLIAFYQTTSGAAPIEGIISYNQGKKVSKISQGDNGVLIEAAVEPNNTKMELIDNASLSWKGMSLSYDNAIILRVTAPLVRKIGSSTEKIVGFIEIKGKLGRDNLHEFSKQHNINVDLAILQENRIVNNLNNITLPQHFDKIPTFLEDWGMDQGPQWFSSQQYYQGIAYIPLANSNRALFIIGTEKDKLNTSIERLLWIMLVILVVSAVAVSLLGFILVNRIIISPVYTLIAGVESAKEGEYKKISGLAIGNEIGHLATEFNKMQEIIQEREKELKAINANLDERAKKAEKSAMQSGKLAALGTLAASLAHELRNPLMGIRGYVDYTGRKATDQKIKDLMGKAEDALEGMSSIINNILTFSRPLEGNTVPTDLREVIGKAIELVYGELRDSNIEVETNFEDSLPMVVANQHGLRQVLVNLLLNSRDALEEIAEGNRWIKIHGYINGKQVMLEVEDNGPGVASNIIDEIFDPFFTTKGSIKGVGLGLAIIKKIICDYGGEIRYIDRPKGGALFLITLDACD